MKTNETRTHYFFRILPFKTSTLKAPADITNLSDPDFFIDNDGIFEIDLDRKVSALVHNFSFSLFTDMDYEMGDYDYNGNFRKIKSGDWILIYKSTTAGHNDPDTGNKIETLNIRIDGKPVQVKAYRRFLGQINRVATKIGINGEASVQTTFISGLSFGTALADTFFYINPFLNNKHAFLSNAIALETANFLSKTILELLKISMATYQKIAHRAFDYIFPRQNESPAPEGGESPMRTIAENNMLVYDYIRLDFTKGETQGKTLLGVHDVSNGTVESLLKRYSNSVKNEMWCDLLPDPDNNNQLVPTLVIREYPFLHRDNWDDTGDKNRFFLEDLEGVTINCINTFVQDIDLGKSSHELFNFFIITPQAMSGAVFKNQSALQAATEDLNKVAPKIAIFGLKVKEGSTLYDSQGEGIDGMEGNENPQWIAYIKKMAALNMGLFGDADNMVSGTITGVFPQYIQLGTKVTLQNVKRRTSKGYKLYTYIGYLVGIKDGMTVSGEGVKIVTETLSLTMGKYIEQVSIIESNDGITESFLNKSVDYKPNIGDVGIA